MLENIMSEAQAALFEKIVAETNKAVIIAHSAPDGDAIGSSLALAAYLHTRNTEVALVMPDSLPDFLMWLPGASDIVCHDVAPEKTESLIADADTVFCLDFNDLSRINALGTMVKNSCARKVMVDHHPEPVFQPELRVCRPDLSSASEVVFRILWQLGHFPAMTKDEAVCVYCGMMTDTGGFTYNSTQPEIFFIISQLLTKGIDKDRIYRNVFNNFSHWAIRLRGYLMSQKLNVFSDLHASYFTISRRDMREYHFIKGDAEGLVNEPLRIKGMKLSVSLREDDRRDNLIWVSLRSVGNFPCNKMAEDFFNGGGHLNASGGRLNCSLAEAEKIVREAFAYYEGALTGWGPLPKSRKENV